MDRRAQLTRVAVGEIKRLTSDPVGVAVEMHGGGNAGWTVTIRLGDVVVSTLIAGSDEDPYAVPQGLVAVVARDLLADARKKASRREVIRQRRNAENRP